MNYLYKQIYLQLPSFAAHVPLGVLQPYAHRSISTITTLAARIPFGQAIAGYLLGKTFYHLFDQGLANILGLETLRHGTNPFSYLGMRVLGGQPRCGGTVAGSTKIAASDLGLLNEGEYENLENHFYVFRDSTYIERDTPFIKKDFRNSKSSILDAVIYIFWTTLIVPAQKIVLPRMHCLLSGYGVVTYMLHLEYNKDDEPRTKTIKTFFRVILGTIVALASIMIVPTVKFRIGVGDESFFKLDDDPSYYGRAYRTTQVIGPWRIGLLGTLVSSISLNWYKRAYANPVKILSGVIQLVGAVAVGALIVQAVATSALATGAIATGMLFC
jgi:hypothetical protein